MRTTLASRTKFLPVIAVACLVALACQLGAAEPIRVLILTGQNNHNWKETTPKLKEILIKSGRFTVDVTEHPEQCDAATFARYDALLSNWNAWGKVAVTNWPAATRTAYLDFIRGGKGLVVVHAGCSTFYDWPEYQQSGGASWKLGETNHGKPREFTVKFADAAHPITRGLEPFRTTDELWMKPGIHPAAKVLATGDDQPLAVTTAFGKGRGFALLLGHNAAFMAMPGFQTLLLRGTEWAATGNATLAAPKPADPDAVLKELAAYRFGDSREPVLALEKLVAAASTDPVAKKTLAAKLVALLGSGATVEAKQAACWQLSIVGSASEAPALEKFISDKDLGYPARLALERIPGDEPLAAMRTALATASGEARVGVINSLANRRDAKAVADIAKLLGDADVATAGAAIEALGKIRSPEAIAALMAADGKVPASLKTRLSVALLRCAERLQPKDAMPILEKLCRANQPAFIRIAAFPAWASALGEKGEELILAALASGDRTKQTAAVRALRATRSPALVMGAVERMKKLPADLQVQVIVLLSERGDLAALPVIADAVESKEPSVREAALTAFGLVGNDSIVSFLAKQAEDATDEEKKIIVTSLARLRGGGVEKTMVAELKEAAPAVQRELIRALVARNAKSVVPALIEASGGKDDGVRKEAIAALGRLGDKTTCAPLLAVAEHSQAAVSALVAICRREGTLEPVIVAFGPASAAKKAALLGVLGGVGGPQALEVARSAMKSGDAEQRLAAVRALAEWSDAAPLDELVAFAAATGDAKCKAFALRGVAKLAPLAKDRPPADVVKLISRAMAAGGGVGERRALLGALGNFHGAAALKAAEACLNDPELAAEAKAAVAQIKSGSKARAARGGPAFTDEVVKLFGAPDNLARGGKATNLDGLSPDGQGQPPFAAIDGNPSTYWDETDQQKLYHIRVQLKERAIVASLRILGYGHHNYAPKDFDVICDGKVVKKVEGAEYKDNLLTLELPPTECSVVELKITGYYSGSPAIRELGIYGPAAATPKKKPAKKKSGLRWERTDTSLALLNDDQTMWQLNFDPKESKPYFHPVALPNGTELTALRPADHVWHRALWWSWKLINGLNYWEEDKKTGLSAGRTDIVATKIATNKDGSARIEMELSCHPPDTAPVLREKRVIALSTPDAAKSYRIDWASTFTAADKEVKLDRTPIPGQPDGKGHGGYAGLSLRMAAATRGWTFTNSEGAAGQADTHGKPARWMDFSGKTAGGSAGGIAVLDHPANSRHPSPWYVAAGMPYFSPALIFNEPLTLPAGGTLTLRYRMLVHTGAVEKAAVEKEWAQFSKMQQL
ncbi:MAG: PmoA family protein [Verrucomicrobia bacterium]|nr:PmoA family protein [Verrucomicrobiota bacterium]